MKTEKKQFRTEEQFESIAENCFNGNWTDASEECVEFGFYANDLQRFNEELELFTDLYDLMHLVELAMKFRYEKTK